MVESSNNSPVTTIHAEMAMKAYTFTRLPNTAAKKHSVKVMRPNGAVNISLRVCHMKRLVVQGWNMLIIMRRMRRAGKIKAGAAYHNDDDEGERRRGGGEKREERVKREAVVRLQW